MHDFLLILHSLLRWVVLVAGIMVIVRALQNLSKAEWNSTHQRWLAIYVHSIGAQFIIGFILYIFVGPVATGSFDNFGATMKDRALRFWAVEHATGMFIALVLAHIGAARVKKAADEAKHKRALLFVGLSLLIILLSMPWPFLLFGRPLFRFWGM